MQNKAATKLDLNPPKSGLAHPSDDRPVLIRFQEVINNKFCLEAFLGTFAAAKIYRARSFNGISICGNCGTRFEDAGRLCNCGSDLARNHFLILEGTDSITRGYTCFIPISNLHPNLLQIYDRFFYRSRYYVLAQNVEFKRLPSDSIRMSPDVVIEWGLQIAEALQFLHSRNLFCVSLQPADLLIHNDKPILANYSSCYKHEGSTSRHFYKIREMRKQEIEALGKLLIWLCDTQKATHRLPAKMNHLFGVLRDLVKHGVQTAESNLDRFQSEMKKIRDDFFGDSTPNSVEDLPSADDITMTPYRKAAFEPDYWAKHQEIPDRILLPESEQPQSDWHEKQLFHWMLGIQTVHSKKPATGEADDTMKGIQAIHGKASHAGLKRQVNQDCVGIFQFSKIINSQPIDIGFYLAADGMGGHADGELASHLAVSLMLHYTFELLFKPPNQKLLYSHDRADIESVLRQILFLTNAEICKAARFRESDLGTTLCALLLINHDAYFVNVGDSRAYIYDPRDGLRLVTQDHSLVFRMYSSGQIDYREIIGHPLGNQLLCTLGDENLEENLGLLQSEADHPFIFGHRIEKHQQILICTDGIWESIHEPEMTAIIGETENPQQLCDRLVLEANRKGGLDNSSIIAIQFSQNEQATAG
ncbi:protein phosphatase 2C domain-containing protein [candidate division KSB1 bacterium]|nr:protein phosphatase 2C domain-containing protein [candidate division KSB1 bacterium]